MIQKLILFHQFILERRWRTYASLLFIAYRGFISFFHLRYVLLSSTYRPIRDTLSISAKLLLLLSHNIWLAHSHENFTRLTTGPVVFGVCFVCALFFVFFFLTLSLIRLLPVRLFG